MSGLSDVWRECKVVCFDVDSTVSLDEGIDVLASFAGVAEAVAELTRNAMSGCVSFEAAISQRLKLIQPTPSMIQKCVETHGLRLTLGAERLVALLHKRGVAVYLISGGFRDFVMPIADALGIDGSRVVANRFVFGSDGVCTGLDDTVPTCRSGGKAAAIAAIQASLSEAGISCRPLAMIGDGVTDLEASPPADVFIGFGGVVARDYVLRRSKFFVYSFDELSSMLEAVLDGA